MKRDNNGYNINLNMDYIRIGIFMVGCAILAKNFRITWR